MTLAFSTLFLILFLPSGWVGSQTICKTLTYSFDC